MGSVVDVRFELRLIRVMREDNERALELLKKQGIKFVQPDAKAAEELEAAFARARKELGPRVIGAIGYPELFNISNTVTSLSGQAIECVLIMAGVYLLISLTIAALMNLYNRAIQIKER